MVLNLRAPGFLFQCLCRRRCLLPLLFCALLLSYLVLKQGKDQVEAEVSPHRTRLRTGTHACARAHAHGRMAAAADLVLWCLPCAAPCVPLDAWGASHCIYYKWQCLACTIARQCYCRGSFTT